MRELRFQNYNISEQLNINGKRELVDNLRLLPTCKSNIVFALVSRATISSIVLMKLNDSKLVSSFAYQKYDNFFSPLQSANENIFLLPGQEDSTFTG